MTVDKNPAAEHRMRVSDFSVVRGRHQVAKIALLCLLVLILTFWAFTIFRFSAFCWNAESDSYILVFYGQIQIWTYVDGASARNRSFPDAGLTVVKLPSPILGLNFRD
ncbi:MAG: hypothetical protein H6818_08605 [Phycisphaerales bacterium]|nr:hypothetical protein [Phycisphaerales bacterium]MCB9862631.1 hypothetical protein [Phycisphaerales bacterium]